MAPPQHASAASAASAASLARGDRAAKSAAALVSPGRGVSASALDRIRLAAQRLAAVETRPDDVRAAVALVEEHAAVDPRAPIDTTNRAAAVAKRVVRKATLFAAHHLALQTSELGQATVRLGTAAASRIEQLEAELTGLRAEVADLRSEVQRLEASR